MNRNARDDWRWDPTYGWTPYLPSTPLARFGQLTEAQTSKASEQGFLAAFKEITPTLILVGIVTGAAFAIGGGLVARYLFREAGGK